MTRTARELVTSHGTWPESESQCLSSGFESCIVDGSLFENVERECNPRRSRLLFHHVKSPVLGNRSVWEDENLVGVRPEGFMLRCEGRTGYVFLNLV